MDHPGTVTVGGVEKELPSNIEPLKDDLYIVPFDMLSLSDSEQDVIGEYHWVNPRHLGARDGSTGQGFDALSMEELYEAIRTNGFISTLTCRWILHPDGTLGVQILDGERRWRTLRKQIDKGELVNNGKGEMQDAAEVFKTVPCRIISGLHDDKEALRIAFMVSDRTVSWGDGATALLIRKLRNCNFTDEEILDITKKSYQWLRDMDELCTLDDTTFNYLIDSRINRTVALKLTKIKDVERRLKHLHESYDDAVLHHQEELAKVDADLEKAETREEELEAALAEAHAKGDEETASELEPKVEKAASRTQRKRRERAEASRPQAKRKNFRAAVIKLAEEEGTEVAADVAQMLGPSAIQKHYATVQELIQNEGKDTEGEVVFPVDILHVVSCCYKAILIGEEDLVKTLRRAQTVQKLMNKRQPPVDVVQEMDDMDDDEDEAYDRDMPDMEDLQDIEDEDEDDYDDDE